MGHFNAIYIETLEMFKRYDNYLLGTIINPILGNFSFFGI
jgi:hypothetical protein